MKRLVRFGFIVLGIVLLGISSLQALTIDFDDLDTLLEGRTGYINMRSYSVAGFTISDTVGSDISFSAPQEYNSLYFGSANLIYANKYSSNPGNWAILSSDSGSFTLNYIDLHGLEEGAQTVTFYAFKDGTPNGSATSLPFDEKAWITFNFGPEFKDVTSVRWQQFEPLHSFDNIVVNVVPEPVSFLLYGLGGLTLGVIKKLKRKKA